MNGQNRKFKHPLSECPKCYMDSGKRMVSETIPEKFYVVCESCGFMTKPHNTQNAATHEWNQKGK